MDDDAVLRAETPPFGWWEDTAFPLCDTHSTHYGLLYMLHSRRRFLFSIVLFYVFDAKRSDLYIAYNYTGGGTQTIHSVFKATTIKKKVLCYASKVHWIAVDVISISRLRARCCATGRGSTGRTRWMAGEGSGQMLRFTSSLTSETNNPLWRSLPYSFFIFLTL